jgi:hypothetical protein
LVSVAAAERSRNIGKKPVTGLIFESRSSAPEILEGRRGERGASAVKARAEREGEAAKRCGALEKKLTPLVSVAAAERGRNIGKKPVTGLIFESQSSAPEFKTQSRVSAEWANGERGRSRRQPLLKPFKESPQMEKQKRFWIALVAYVLLGLLIWTTMSDVPIRIGSGQISIRGLTLAIVAFFAVRTFLHWRSNRAESQDKDEEFEGWGAAVVANGWLGGTGKLTNYQITQLPNKAGGSNSVVESQPSKLLVAGSIPVSRSRVGSASEESRQETN